MNYLNQSIFNVIFRMLIRSGQHGYQLDIREIAKDFDLTEYQIKLYLHSIDEFCESMNLPPLSDIVEYRSSVSTAFYRKKENAARQYGENIRTLHIKANKWIGPRVIYV